MPHAGASRVLTPTRKPSLLLPTALPPVMPLPSLPVTKQQLLFNLWPLISVQQSVTSHCKHLVIFSEIHADRHFCSLTKPSGTDGRRSSSASVLTPRSGGFPTAPVGRSARAAPDWPLGPTHHPQPAILRNRRRRSSWEVYIQKGGQPWSASPVAGTEAGP